MDTPCLAVVTTREVADSFNNGMEYFNTFGGNPVSCVAGLAVLDVIEHNDLRRNALEIGNYLIAGFRSMQDRFDIIGDVRGQGLSSALNWPWIARRRNRQRQ